jgi:hypothetical protein
MSRRSNNSEYQPAPPINRIPYRKGVFGIAIAVREGNTGGVKPNTSVPPPPGSKRQIAIRFTMK